MADLPDYYTQAQISEAEAASFKGGLEANLPDHPLSRDIYLASDTHILYVCFVDDAWTGFDAAILTQGILTLYANMLGGGKRITNIANAAAAQDALTLAQLQASNELMVRKTGSTMTGDLTIEKDTPKFTLKATEENGQEWALEEFVYGGVSWIKIENKVTDTAFFLSATGQVEVRVRLTVASSPVGGEENPKIWLENTDAGANQWYFENDTPDAKIWSLLAGVLLLPSTNPATDNTKHLGALDKRWTDIFALHHSITQALGTDHRWSGTTAPMTAGIALTIGQAVYVGGDSKMEKALATAAATMPAIALATGTIAEDDSGEFLMQGFFRDDTWDWTPGGLLYVSRAAAGALTQTLPAVAGEQVQVVGVAISADIIHFNPSYELVEVS